jgi:site-specific DNA-methyltransferase (adenine-specific)
MLRIFNGDSLEWLRADRRYDLIFADPPDNIGLKYDGYVDKVPDAQYYERLELLMHYAMQRCKVFWLSYYWRHDLELKRRAWSATRRNGWNAKTFIWRFTFGQHTDADCGSGFRYLLRLSAPSWKPDTTGIRVQSTRQAIGDKRANPDGRVPDDVWEFDADGVWHEFPRVTGNSEERREWHPTQHPEGVIERIMRLSLPGLKGKALDCYGGTGTSLRVAKKLGVSCDAIEIDMAYAQRIATEMGLAVSGF